MSLKLLLIGTLNLTFLTVLTAIFQVNLGYPVTISVDVLTVTIA